MPIDQRGKPRIIVTVSEGLVSGVYFDNMDLSGVDLITIDYDTEGATEDDGVTTVGGDRAFFSVGEVTKAEDDLARDVGRAYLAWGSE